MLTALPGHVSIQEMGFPLGVFTLIFLSSTDSAVFRASPTQVLTQGQKVPDLFRRVCSLAAREAFYKRTFGSFLQILIFKSCRGQKHCSSCPRTHCPGLPALAKHPRSPAQAAGPRATATQPRVLGSLHPAQGAMADGCFLCSCRIFRASIARRYRSGGGREAVRH